jgi:hypothetical protein
MSNLLRDMPLQPKNFTFAEPPVEYFANEDSLIEEYLEGVSLGSVYDQVTSPNEDKAPIDTILGKSNEQWQEWFRDFFAYTDGVDKRFRVIMDEYKDSPLKKADLDTVNWLIRSIDPASGLPALSLIDQAPAPMLYASGDAAYVNEVLDTERAATNREAFGHDPTLSYLRAMHGPAAEDK